MCKEKSQRTFGRKYAEAWHKISSDREGQFKNKNGIFTFTTIYPWFVDVVSRTVPGETSARNAPRLKGNERYWKVVSHITKETVESQTGYLRRWLLAGDGVIITILGISLWMISASGARRREAEISLRIGETRLSELFNHMGSGVVVYTPQPGNHHEFLIADINRKTENLGKLKKADVIGKPMGSIFPDMAETGFADVLQRVWESGQAEYFPARAYENEKLIRCLECYIYKLPSDELVAVYDDVTARIQAEDEAAFEYALNEASAKISTMLLSADSLEKVSYLLIEEARNLTYSKYGFTAFIDSESEKLVLSGYTRETINECQLELCMPMLKKKKGLMQEIIESRKPAIINSSEEYGLTGSFPEGHVAIHRLIAVPAILEDNLVGLVAVANADNDYHDTELKVIEHLASLYALSVQQNKADQQIRHLAHHDPLTGLANRSLYSDRLNQAIIASRRQGKKTALLYIDLDDFKPINDTLGHKAGDSVLKEVAARLVVLVREADTVCRMGGDEFVIILQDLEKKEGAEIVAKKIIKTLTHPFTIEATQCVLGASIGISICPDDGDDSDSIQKKADEAMYFIKKQSKNNYAFYDEVV